MKTFNWNEDKNRWLKQERGVSFEQVVFCIESGKILDIIKHPNPVKYQHQQFYVIDINRYVFIVPYVENENVIFLKTVFPRQKVHQIISWSWRAIMKAFDKEEIDLMESIENEEWVSVDNLDEEIKKARAAAKATMIKSERMNIRISPRDLNGLKIKAMEEGVPYQTLVSSIIHKYISGRLISKEM